MKEIIAHRGFWLTESEKNSVTAFKRSLESGFGIETDIRDHDSKLVISHDIPKKGKAFLLEDFFDLYNSLGHERTLALNIKSDGLQSELSKAIEQYNIKNYFFFDMSVPDTLLYQRHNLKYYTRKSDIEPVACLLENATGTWIDCFLNEEWIFAPNGLDNAILSKEMCFVSPELHKRDHFKFWDQLKKANLSNCMICTDFPDKAKEYFI